MTQARVMTDSPPNQPTAEVIHMADRSSSPQLEDGYTKIANELLDAVMRFSFSSRQYAVVLAVMRKTYGYNKKMDDIGLSQIVKLTGIDKSNVSKTVRSLADMRVIIRSQGQFGHNLSINKKYNQWLVVKSTPPVVKTTTPKVVELTTPYSGQNDHPLPVVKSTTGGVVDLANTPVVKTTTTKDNHTKEKQPKEFTSKQVWTNEAFDAFWLAWPIKKAKKKAREAFNKINPDPDLLNQIISAVEFQKKSNAWIKDGGEFIPMAATWLHGQRWEDEVKPAIGSFNDKQLKFIAGFNDNIGDRCLPVGAWSQLLEDRINTAMSGKWTMEKWVGYWLYVRDKCHFKGNISFEWLIDRDNLVRVVRGEFEVQS